MLFYLGKNVHGNHEQTYLTKDKKKTTIVRRCDTWLLILTLYTLVTWTLGSWLLLN